MKIMLVLLILIIVLFVVFVTLGSSYNGKSSSNWKSFNPKDHSIIAGMGSMFGSPGPKLAATDLKPSPAPLRRAHPVTAAESSKFVLKSGDQPTTFEIAPDSKHQFREATFVVSRDGCADIGYRTADGSGGNLDNKRWPDVGKDPDHPTKVTFQVLSARGYFSFSLNGSDCSVQLQ